MIDDCRVTDPKQRMAELAHVPPLSELQRRLDEAERAEQQEREQRAAREQRDEQLKQANREQRIVRLSESLVSLTVEFPDRSAKLGSILPAVQKLFGNEVIADDLIEAVKKAGGHVFGPDSIFPPSGQLWPSSWTK